MPRITVVVPIYNVERYLPDCLESLRQQTVHDLEVVMIDDGSTDSSASVAAGFAERDARFRLVTQPNTGLAQARNAGVAHGQGEFLAFVDADDMLPAHAYEAMVGSLDQTGSDFATGNVHRLTSFGIRRSPMFTPLFATTRPKTHVGRHPALLNDRFAPNKLWRRSFWEDHRLQFPAQEFFVDGPVVVPAHVLARSVDVLSTPVYHWRVRPGEDRSIGLLGTDPRAIQDRFQAIDAISRFLDSHDPALKRLYDRACADQDVRDAMQQLVDADDECRDLFLDLANDFFARADGHVFDELPAVDRLKYHLVRRRLMTELVDVLKFERTGEINRTPVVRRRRKFYGDYPFRADARLRVPSHVYRLDQELELRARIDDVWWEGEALWVEGFAYIGRIDQRDQSSNRIELQLRQVIGGRRIVQVPVEPVHRPDVTAEAKEGLFRYHWSGFRASVPASTLKPARGWRDAFWRLRVEVRSAGVTRWDDVTATTPGRAQRPDFLQVDGVRLVPTTENGNFGIAVDTMPAVVRCCRVEDDVLELEGCLTGARPDPADPATGSIQVSRQLGSTTLTYPVAFSPRDDGSSAFVTRIPLKDLAAALEVSDRAAHSEGQDDGVVWELSILPGDGAELVRLTGADTLTEVRRSVEGREVVLRRSRRGRLVLDERDFRPEVQLARWTHEDTIELEGTYHEPTGARSEMVLSARGRLERHVFPMHRDGERFRVSMGVAAVKTLAGSLPLTEGTWDVLARPVARPGGTTRVKLDRKLLSTLPLEHSVGVKDFALGDLDFDNAALVVGPSLAENERGAFNQNRLQTVDFPAFLRRPLRDAVLFESYSGTQYADSPRAIQEELAHRGCDLELLWGVTDAQTELPDGVTPVRRLSSDWYEAMARSRYVVTCVYRPLQRWVSSPDDQVVLQTWHGPPFKRIGFDNTRFERLSANDYHERLYRETSRWDYLISPNPVASPVLRSAFRYQGNLLETGYPRTDVFFRPDRDALAARVRERLGIPVDKTVVMYAPTFRDDQRLGGRHRLDLRLELDQARRSLSDDHVLLVRRHTKIVDAVPGAGTFVLDVSAYPDVNELLLATDVLVTDYSSLMFDFANTGRPMLFFTYDLDDYRDRLRGFYFDIERVPGPLLRTSADVIDSIGRAKEVRAEYDSTYREFTRDFCAFDDGHASARVVDDVFGR